MTHPGFSDDQIEFVWEKAIVHNIKIGAALGDVFDETLYRVEIPPDQNFAAQENT
jgi:hypothetical protein